MEAPTSRTAPADHTVGLTDITKTAPEPGFFKKLLQTCATPREVVTVGQDTYSNKKQHSSLLSSRHGNPKKLMDLLGPLLGSSPTAAGNNNILPSAQKPFALATPGKPVVVSLYAVCASDSDVASTASSSSERNSSNSDTPLEPVNMSALAQSLSTSSNRLTEFMNKMRLAEPAVQKGWKIGPDGEETGAPTFGSPKSSDCIDTRSSAPTPRCKASPHASLDKLLESARNCTLPSTVAKAAAAAAAVAAAAAAVDPSAKPIVPTLPPRPAPVATTMLAVSQMLPPRMARESWCLTDYIIGDKLYTGYASTVYKALCKSSGEVVVLKIYTLSSVCDLYKFQIYREVRLHSNTCHENIVHLYASFQEGDQVVMVQEYADGADLFNLLHKYGGRLSERLAVQMVMDPFLRVLHHLHTNAIVHRDIKPENIMFTKEMGLKLGDFGLAIDLREERAVTRAGTLDYMAPEVLKCPFKSRPDENKQNTGLHYSNRVDAWAVGVLTYELLVGFPPFFDQSRTGTEERIMTSTPIFPANLSEDAKSFICCALQKDAINRPTTLEMLHHPWIESFRNRRSMRPPTKHVTHVHASPLTLSALQALLPTAPPTISSHAPSPLSTFAAVASPTAAAAAAMATRGSASPRTSPTSPPEPSLHYCNSLPLWQSVTSLPASPTSILSAPLSAELPSLDVYLPTASTCCPLPTGVPGASPRHKVDSPRPPTAQLRTRLTLGVPSPQAVV